MKELKDYLHLYLGCECNTPDGVLILNGININDSRNQVWFYCRWNDKKNCYLPKQNAEILNKQSLVGKSFKYSQIKPILRPLSDMTIEEARGLFDVGLAPDFAASIIKEISASLHGLYNRIALMGDFDTIPKLLKMGFDLFGLIEAGLAIDKNTLK